MTTFLRMMSKFTFEKLIVRVEERWTMRKLKADEKTFKNFGYARYATDVTFQQFFWSSGNTVKGKKVFSGKQKLYGYRIYFLVLPTGFCIGCTKRYPGYVSELEIFCQKL